MPARTLPGSVAAVALLIERTKLWLLVLWLDNRVVSIASAADATTPAVLAFVLAFPFSFSFSLAVFAFALALPLRVAFGSEGGLRGIAKRGNLGCSVGLLPLLLELTQDGLVQEIIRLLALRQAIVCSNILLELIALSELLEVDNLFVFLSDALGASAGNHRIEVGLPSPELCVAQVLDLGKIGDVVHCSGFLVGAVIMVHQQKQLATLRCLKCFLLQRHKGIDFA